MSENNLAHSGQFEVNAKSPTVVETADTDSCNMKVGIAWNHELGEFHYGFVAKGYGLHDMGRISENFTQVDSHPLVYFQVQGDNNKVHLDFDGNQPLSATEITLTIGSLDPIVMAWNGTNFNYETAEIAGLGLLFSKMVGGTYQFKLEVTAP